MVSSLKPGPSALQAQPPLGLCRRPLFVRVQSHGSKRRGRQLTLMCLSNGLPGVTRLGLTVSGRVGPAVVRNRVKRRLREIVRACAGLLLQATDYVLVAHPSARQASFAVLATEAQCLMQRARPR